MQILDIINGSIQDIDLAHLLHGLGAGNVQLQRVKAAVDVLHPAALAGIALDRLEVLLRLDVVAMHRMHYHHFASRCHGGG